ncbi:unnamed protein product [Moneuplotes crassus]|uniref:J domain-containing protein n=1 Tax=Euplotes crassus TaxID=5936 RepID=A0AAD1XVR7_EUPCR|nr:unnamed protein product [Moneuplotes crassus]
MILMTRKLPCNRIYGKRWFSAGVEAIEQARKVMKLCSDQKICDDVLKKAYLEKAKLYHPDRGEGGSDEKFKQLQEAFETLKKLPEHQRTNQNEKYEEYFKHTYSPKQKQYYDEKRRQEYEKWRRDNFLRYNQQKHEEFLSQRYRMNQSLHSDFTQRRHDLNSSGHFHSSTGTNEGSPSEQIPKKNTFKTNNLLVAFVFNRKFRSRFIWRYREEMFCFMICFAIVANLIFYRGLTKKERLDEKIIPDRKVKQ